MYAYATLISSDSYLDFLHSWILFYKLAKSKYDACVIITDNVNEKAKLLCEENNINYIIVPLKLYNQNEYSPRYRSTWNKFYLWSLIVYEKVLYIDIDMNFLNCDAILEDDSLILPHFYMRINVNQQGLGICNKFALDGACYIIKPDTYMFAQLIDDNNASYVDDEHQLNDYFIQHYLTNCFKNDNGTLYDNDFLPGQYVHKFFHEVAAREADQYFMQYKKEE